MQVSAPIAVLWLALVTLLAAPAQVPAHPDAAGVARLVQQKYDQVHDFKADFVHTYQGGVLRKNLTERGVVQIKKPGRMRWEYKDPEEKLFVSDGHKMYSYVPADKQVIVSTVPQDDQASTAVLFLAGRGDLPRDFTASFADAAAAGTWTLKLEPKVHQPEYDWLVLSVDRATLQIRGLTAADRQGTRSTFAFSNVKENVDMPDTLFTFKIPRGVDVIVADR
ncbi:MAG TPA: outer membrane lipoprotein chaperone LolA [Vicinamibacterales bacterium]|nr:outer membrane lipoprotein chaperone LolA [Vicinamibacterales bacterium]